MSVLGSVKNRIKTMLIINRNRKKKQLNLEEEIKRYKQNKKTVFIKQSIITKLNEKPLVSKSLKKIEVPITTYNKLVKGARKKVEINPVNVKNNVNKQVKKNIEKVLKPIPNILTPTPLILKKDKKKVQKVLLEKKDKIVNKKEETKIINRVNLFLNDAKKEIKKLKNDLLNEEERLKKIKDKESFEKEEKRIEEIHNKIIELTDILEKLALQYNFKYYEELNDELLFKYIDDFKFKNNLNTIDSLVEKCQIEAKKLDYLDILTIKVNELGKLKDKKKEKINYLERDYDNKTIDIIKLDRKEELIKNYILKEEEYVRKLNKEINDSTLDKTVTSKLILDKNYLNNLFRLGIGISAFQTTFVGAFIGAFIIKSATSNLLMGAFKKKEYTNYFYKYQEFTSKIKTNIDLLDETLYLVNSSLNDIIKLKADMETTYNEYLENSKYKEMYQRIVEIEKHLLKKEQTAIEMKHKLQLNEEKNKEKQKKLEEYNRS